jgi:hypothetical protein
MSCKYKLKYILGVGILHSPDRLFSDEFDNTLIDSLIRSEKVKETLKEWINVSHAKICDAMVVSYTCVLAVIERSINFILNLRTTERSLSLNINVALLARSKTNTI